MLPTYKILFADKEQTPQGRKFWGYCISKALEDGYFVYAVDKRSNPNVIYKIENEIDLILNRNILWGTDEGHKRTFAAISTYKLGTEDV